MDIPAYIWLPVYFHSMFSIAKRYNVKNNNCAKAMFQYFTSLSEIVPNSYFKRQFKYFLSFNPEVVRTIISLDVLNSFFSAYPIIKETLIKNPDTFINQCYSNSDLMFIYVYLMYIYMVYIQNNLGFNIHYPTFFDLQKTYNPDLMTKSDWGRPTWFTIHLSALYSEENDNMIVNYKNFLEALQYILPCEQCQAHLKENIKYINFKNCGKSNKDLFKCSWELHNIVNRSLNKYTPSFEEALNYYSINNLKKNSPYSYSVYKV